MPDICASIKAKLEELGWTEVVSSSNFVSEILQLPQASKLEPLTPIGEQVVTKRCTKIAQRYLQNGPRSLPKLLAGRGELNKICSGAIARARLIQCL